MSGPTPKLRARWLFAAEVRRLVFLAPVLLALLSFVLLLITAFELVQWPEDGTQWSSLTHEIESIEPGSPAAQVLEPHDSILAVNGVSLSAVSPLYLGKRPGDSIPFTIERAGRVSTFPIRLIAPSLNNLLDRLEPLLIALFFLLIGIAVWSFKPADKMAILFFGFNQLAGVTLIMGTLSTIGVALASQLFAVALWFLAPLTIHLHLRFPSVKVISRERGFLLFFYGLAVVGSLSRLAADAGLFPGIPLGEFSQVGTRLYLVICFLIAAILLIRTYRRVVSTQVRQQIRLLSVGGALALISSGALVLLPEALFGKPLVPYNLAFLFWLTIPLVYGYSIVRYRLIMLDLPLSRTLVYTCLIILLIAFYLLLDAGLMWLMPPTLSYEPWGHAVLAVIVALTYAPLRNRLQAGIDWAFYGGWYDYRTAVQKLSQAMDDVTDFPSLAQVLLDNLQETLKLECACVMLRDGEGHFSRKRACERCAAEQMRKMELDERGALCQWLVGARQPIQGDRLGEQLKGIALTTDEQRLLDCGQNGLWVPLVERDMLLGILLLGPKHGDALFGGEDFHILEVVRRQASITIQNISLLQELRQRAEDMERLHQQLLRAREEERKRLARELHDNIVQSLVGLNYELSHLETPQGASLGGNATHLQHQVHAIMGEMRRVCSELRPPALDSLGLVSAIRSRLRELEAEGTLQVRFSVAGDEEMILSEEVEICLYRVLQEALVNVQKHAQATQVQVTLTLQPAEVTLSVQDNGRGFATPARLGQLLNHGHFGLVGARERLELVGGKLTLRSAPNTGTCLEALVPCQAAMTKEV